MSSGQSSDFHASGAAVSRLETQIIEKVCEPVLARLPRSIHPNTISLFTHLLCWVTAALAVSSAQLPPLLRSLALLGAGLGNFGIMVGDCLDGMQARRTNRCSKLGEMLDHWLDSVGVPLVTLGVTSALQLSPWLIVAVHVTSTMIYNAQLVLYYYSGKFVHPGTTGVDAQLGVAFGYLVAAILFLLVDPAARWLQILLMVASLMAVLMQLRLNLFYYVRLRGRILHHLKFVALCGVAAALYLIGAMDRLAFLLLVVLFSFRITGGYVQATILKRSFGGFDVPAALGLLAVTACYRFAPGLQLAGLPVLRALPFLLCLYLVGRNLIELAGAYRQLKP